MAADPNPQPESSPDDPPEAFRPQTCLPQWEVGELSAAQPRTWRDWKRFVGPGIVMMGIQIGGGEWLFGPEITARYGGGLMWIATVAILVQVFYNMECGRYALYCGEPVFTGFLRTRPGPPFWITVFVVLNAGALIPGLSTHAASVIAALWLGRPPDEGDRGLILALGYMCLAGVTLPVLFGGKIYNTLQTVMTIKVVVVLGFTLFVGVFFVSAESWLAVFSGFFKFGSVPVADADGGETVVNAFSYYWSEGAWPVVALANIAVLGAFAGYAGGGGLSNSTYSNYVRDKGWGMGRSVGAIASAVGGKDIRLSHLGTVFPVTEKSLTRWRGWWRYVVTDQVLIWAPGCFVGMALPALISMEYSRYSPLYNTPSNERFDWAQAVISADGLRHAPEFSPLVSSFFWFAMVFVGLMVLLPSQMSIVDDFSRRWTDVIWSGSSAVRKRLHGHQVRYIYYGILSVYVLWSIVALYIFNTFGTPKLMVLVIANLNNIAIGVTALMILRVNTRILPKALRPRWYHRLGLVSCAVFYLSLAVLVFATKQLPLLREWLSQ
jgi:hypothetical protein